MRTYEGMKLPPTMDPYVRNELLKVDKILRELGPALRYALTKGNNPRAAVTAGSGPGGSPSTLPDHNHSESGQGGKIIGVPNGAINMYGRYGLHLTTPVALLDIGKVEAARPALRVHRYSNSDILDILQVVDENNSACARFFIDGSNYSNLVLGNSSYFGAIGLTDALSGFIGYFFAPALSGDRNWTYPDEDGVVLIDLAIQDVGNKTLQVTNTLLCNTNAQGVSFAHTSSTTKRLRMITSGSSTSTNNAFSVVTTASRTFIFPDAVNPNVVVAENAVNLTGQTAAIGTTNIRASGHPAGLYRVDVVALCTTASGAGTPTLDVTIGWTDNVGATTQNAVTGLALSATGRASGSVLLRSTAAAAITYATAINTPGGSPQYALYIRLEHLG